MKTNKVHFLTVKNKIFMQVTLITLGVKVSNCVYRIYIINARKEKIFVIFPELNLMKALKKT